MVLKDIISDVLYLHFLKLLIGIRILLHPSTCKDYNGLARGFLREYVRHCPRNFGNRFMSTNVHGLIHLADDALTYGHLDRVSAFPFESLLGELKNLIRKPGAKLAQIVRRIYEIDINRIFKEPLDVDSSPVLSSTKHSNGPMLPNITGTQHVEMEYLGFTFTLNQPDNYMILNDGNVLVLKNIVETKSKDIVVLGCLFSSRDNLFTVPISEYVKRYFKSPMSQEPFLSTMLDISKVSGEKSNRVKCFPVSAIRCKAVCIPNFNCRNNSYAIFPVYMESND